MQNGARVGQFDNKSHSYDKTFTEIKSVEEQEKRLAVKKQEILHGLDQSIEEGTESINRLMEKADGLTFERTPLKEKRETEKEQKKSYFSFLDCFNCFK
ncbi:MAG: hypothetical protein K0R08_875 [Solimicrobium sp.]|jgi:hypothetical protein|nr:hypothetical protein [Solimicrobium sp.]